MFEKICDFFYLKILESIWILMFFDKTLKILFRNLQKLYLKETWFEKWKMVKTF